MKARYIRLMDAIHGACLFVAGACLVVITLVVPYGVFTRYVLNSAASWPEPVAVLLMFMLWWGIKLVQATWYQSLADFPVVSAGAAYLPIPIGGGLTTLFVIERFLTGKFFSEPEPETVSQITTE